MDNWINLVPILFLLCACFYILLTNHWQKTILGYAVAYISAFSIIVQYWSFSFSLVKLLTALMSLVILGISIYKHSEIERPMIRSEQIFRLVTLSLIYIIVVFIVTRISNYLSIPLEITLASLLIVGFSVFQLGITQEPRRLFLAIIVLFFGFELIFSANEASLLVNGLLAFITLLVALIGGYVIINEFEGGEE